jgi:hypothetical protein
MYQDLKHEIQGSKTIQNIQSGQVGEAVQHIGQNVKGFFGEMMATSHGVDEAHSRAVTGSSLSVLAAAAGDASFAPQFNVTSEFLG